MNRLGLGKYPAAQNQTAAAPDGEERWIDTDAKDHLANAAGAGYGGSNREYAFAR
jgi:hypothetical protein